MVARQRGAPVAIAVRPPVARRRPSRRSALAAVDSRRRPGDCGLLAPAAAAQTPPRPNAKAFEKYRKCLAKHGVKLPKNGGFPGGGPPGGSLPSGATPGGALPRGGTRQAAWRQWWEHRAPSLPKGVSQKKFDKAQKACRSKLPNGGRGGGPGGGSEAFQAYSELLARPRCRRALSPARTDRIGRRTSIRMIRRSRPPTRPAACWLPTRRHHDDASRDLICVVDGTFHGGWSSMDCSVSGIIAVAATALGFRRHRHEHRDADLDGAGATRCRAVVGVGVRQRRGRR